jgi:anti-sigma B factor antagonist
MSGKSDFTSQLETDEHNRLCVVTLTGNFDPVAVEELQPQIQELVNSGFRRYVFDLSQLQHIGSLGLRLLVGLHNQMKGNGAVVLCSVSSRVQAILDLTKVRNVLQQYSSRADAVDAARSR